jgi:formylglycine-generating enzyme required for sulfatase activity
MHGNIGEWCQDHWHDNYKDAPTNGSAWLFPAEKESKNDGTRVLRCASWVNSPMECRSAYRNYLNPDARISRFFGFRVVCTAAGAFL